MYILENLPTVGYTSYNIYVTKTTSTDLSMDNLCGRIYQAKSNVYGNDISCLAGKILTGDQIVIERITDSGRIQLYDVRVYRKYIFFMSSLNT